MSSPRKSGFIEHHRYLGSILKYTVQDNLSARVSRQDFQLKVRIGPRPYITQNPHKRLEDWLLAPSASAAEEKNCAY